MGATDLTSGLLWMTGGYVVVLLVLGTLGRRARTSASLADHFLADRSIGFAVLLLTLFATQYSGNSLSGFPGKTYREGLPYFMSVTFMVGIVTGYTLFAPRLFRLSRARGFVTPTDFLRERFASPALDWISVAIFVFVLGNFLLAQLMAIGHAFSGLTGGQIDYATAVVGGATIVLAYELLGGMRAVAWTDALQGGILVVGLLLAAILVVDLVGTPAAVIQQIHTLDPVKVENPSLRTCLVWAGNFLLLGLGAPLYPQAIQRIYAARRFDELRRALGAMAVLPLVAITTVVFLGLAGIVLFPGLEKVESDRITFLILGHLVQETPAATIPALVVMLAVVAAIMSTADSCLLSLTSILVRDVGGRNRRTEDLEGGWGSRWTPLVSTLTLALLVAVALQPRLTLWGLLVIKFEVLIQLSPAFVLGVQHDRDDPGGVGARDILTGLAAGLAFFLVCRIAGLNGFHGFHAGSAAVLLNYATVLLSWRLRAPRVRATMRP